MMLLTFLLSSLFACSSAQLRANRRRITGFVGIEGPSHEPEPLECHPAATQILAADGTATPISQLTLGARVASPSGPKRVIAITHSDATMDGSYVRLTTASGAAVEISARHLLPVNGVLKDPIKVAVGDLLQTPAGPEAVARVEVVVSCAKRPILRSSTRVGEELPPRDARSSTRVRGLTLLRVTPRAVAAMKGRDESAPSTRARAGHVQGRLPHHR